MNWFDILAICIIGAAVIAAAAVVIYNKLHGKGGDCDGCPGCSRNCSACGEGRCKYKIPEDIQEQLRKAQAKDSASGAGANANSVDDAQTPQR